MNMIPVTPGLIAPSATPQSNSKPAVSSEPRDVFRPSSPKDTQDIVPPQLAQALQAAGRPYYDEARDKKDIAAYYNDVHPDGNPSEFYDELHTLVTRTHHERFGFDPEKRLFPWVDLRPNLRLQSIYSPNPVAIDAPLHVTKSKDFIIKTKVQVPGRVAKDGSVGEPHMKEVKMDLRGQAEKWSKALLEHPTDALQIAQKIAAIEGQRYFNGEHSVPQYFFDHDKDPKGDLHHLFACERDSNSARGCRPYHDVEQIPENHGKDGWAPKGVNEFMPEAGRGPVARATLYFLARYPGKVGDRPGEYTKKDLETMLRWSRENPVSLYEKHRNQAIAEIQGNRNPFIDHPEWAEKVDFTKAFGAYGQTAEVSGATGPPI